jgi:CDP-diacylglycerol--glycerol-3-phosphate 3-phosphatidyltransferase
MKSPRQRFFNIANILTLLRVVLIPVFVLLLLRRTPASGVAALLVFVSASLTDYLDGIVARTRGLQSRVGEFMDPLADKLLVGSAFVCFSLVPGVFVPLWLVAVVILRELFVTVMRIVAIRRKVPIKTEFLGKIKTFFQMITILLILVVLILYRYEADDVASMVGTDAGGFWVDTYGQCIGEVLFILPAVLVGISALLALVSMIQYCAKNRQLFSTSFDS